LNHRRLLLPKDNGRFSTTATFKTAISDCVEGKCAYEEVKIRKLARIPSGGEPKTSRKVGWILLI
jgi:hypothetical protein